MDIGREIMTIRKANNHNTELPSGLALTLNGDHKFPGLLTGGYMTTCNCDSSKGRGPLGHITDKGGLGDHPEILL